MLLYWEQWDHDDPVSGVSGMTLDSLTCLFCPFILKYDLSRVQLIWIQNFGGMAIMSPVVINGDRDGEILPYIWRNLTVGGQVRKGERSSQTLLTSKFGSGPFDRP